MFKSLKDLLYITEYLLDGPNGEIKTLEVSESKEGVFNKLFINIANGVTQNNHSMAVLKASSYEFRNSVNGVLINEYFNPKRAAHKRFEPIDIPDKFDSEQLLLDMLNHINENRELIIYDKDSAKSILYLDYKLHISPNFVGHFIGVTSADVRKDWLEKGFVETQKEMVKGIRKYIDTKGVRINNGSRQPRFIVIDQGFIKKHKLVFNNQFEKEKVYI